MSTSRSSVPGNRADARGFTLVETMVAVTVLAIALIGPFSAVESALNASYVARDELTASSLAQEGMEYIRSVRDGNYLNGRAWMDKLSTFSCYGAAPANFCVVDPTQGDVHTNATAIASYTPGHAPPLYVSATSLYNQQHAGTVSRFTRTVQMKQLSNTEVQVTVIVSWTSAHQAYSATVVDTLENWL